MSFLDMHCDTLLKLASFDAVGDIYESESGSVDIRRIEKAGGLGQIFAIFMMEKKFFSEENIPYMDDETYIRNRVDFVVKSIENHSDKASLVLCSEDFDKNMESGKVSVFMSIEDGRSIKEDISNVKKYYDMGIRQIGLLWNHENSLGYPNSTDISIMKKGLKKTGIDVISEMNRLGMIIDVSHLNDGGFYDVARYSSKPFIASHSNARGLCNHPRNLTDEMIKVLSDKGGIMGLNFVGAFLNSNAGNLSKIDDMISMAHYIRNTGGIEVLGLGSDLDGFDGELEIDSIDKMPILLEKLHDSGFTYDEVDMIGYKNFRRVIKDIL